MAEQVLQRDRRRMRGRKAGAEHRDARLSSQLLGGIDRRIWSLSQSGDLGIIKIFCLKISFKGSWLGPKLWFQPQCCKDKEINKERKKEK